MKLILTILAVLLGIASVLAGLYVAFYVCLYGGILQVIEGAKANPVDASNVAFGVVRVLATGLAGWLTFLFGAVITAICSALASGSK